MRPRFIDTHAHLVDEAYCGPEGNSEAEEVLLRAKEAGICAILHPDIDSVDRAAAWELCSQHQGYLFPMVGLYPGSVKDNWEEEIEIAFRNIPKETVAVGEIGLDYHWSTEFVRQQKEAFKAQLEIASKLGLPINIHLRDATEDFFSVMEECRGLELRGNVHAFSGSYETYKRLQKYGHWKVGIGGVVTYKNAKVAESVKDIPLEDILLETDAPYLPPVPHRGQRNEPSMIPLIAEKIAQIKGIDTEEVAEVTTDSAIKLFSLVLK